MNMTNKIKIIALIVAIAAGAAAGTEFYRMWNFREPSVIGEQTTVKKLSDYDPQIKGTNNAVSYTHLTLPTTERV